MCNGSRIFDAQLPGLQPKIELGGIFDASLLTVQTFAAERTGALHHAAGQIRSLGFQLKRELPMIGDMTSQKVVTDEIERKLLVPRGVDLDHLRVGFVAISQELNFASAVPCKVERSRRVADIVSVNFHQRARWVGIDRDATMHAADLCQREQHE